MSVTEKIENISITLKGLSKNQESLDVLRACNIAFGLHRIYQVVVDIKIGLSDLDKCFKEEGIYNIDDSHYLKTTLEEGNIIALSSELNRLTKKEVLADEKVISVLEYCSNLVNALSANVSVMEKYIENLSPIEKKAIEYISSHNVNKEMNSSINIGTEEDSQVMIYLNEENVFKYANRNILKEIIYENIVNEKRKDLTEELSILDEEVLAPSFDFGMSKY